MATSEPLTAEEVDGVITRLGIVRGDLDIEYRATQARLQDIGGRRAAVEDAILTLATAGRQLRETGAS